MKEQLISQLITFILGAVGILSTYVLTQLGLFLNQNKKKVATEKGISNYNRGLQIAKGMYTVLEDEFKSVEKSGLSKKAEMDSRLLKLIPELTQDELDAINKQIWSEFNTNVVNVVTTPVEVPAPVPQEQVAQPIDQTTPDPTKDQPQPQA